MRRSGYLQKFREGAVVGNAQRASVGAAVAVARQAFAAMSAAGIRRDDDRSCRKRRAHVAPDLDDLADDLMAEHAHRAGGNEAMLAGDDAMIGAADAAMADAEQRIVRPDLRPLPILDPEVAGPVIDGRAHQFMTSASRTGRSS